MAELRKAKELNDRLDLEIRALRVRVRCLDAEKSSLQQTVRYDDGRMTLYIHFTSFFGFFEPATLSVHINSATHLHFDCAFEPVAHSK